MTVKTGLQDAFGVPSSRVNGQHIQQLRDVNRKVARATSQNSRVYCNGLDPTVLSPSVETSGHPTLHYTTQTTSYTSIVEGIIGGVSGTPIGINAIATPAMRHRVIHQYMQIDSTNVERIIGDVRGSHIGINEIATLVRRHQVICQYMQINPTISTYE
jgi:hypothetical protein